MMTKKIFDIYSSDTFNALTLPFFDNDFRKDVVFPPWLRLPSHYTKDLWRQVIPYIDGMMYLKLIDRLNIEFKLNCNHTTRLSEMAFNLINKDVRRIRVNCEKCGGTGEIKFI